MVAYFNEGQSTALPLLWGPARTKSSNVQTRLSLFSGNPPSCRHFSSLFCSSMLGRHVEDLIASYKSSPPPPPPQSLRSLRHTHARLFHSHFLARHLSLNETWSVCWLAGWMGGVLAHSSCMSLFSRLKNLERVLKCRREEKESFSFARGDRRRRNNIP